MLVLTRKAGESLVIGDNVEITIIEIESGKIKIGINAPKELKIYRKEIFDEIQDENKGAAAPGISFDKLKGK